MKPLTFFITVTCLICALNVSGFGQKREIGKDEYISATNNARRKTTNTPYRATDVSMYFQNDENNPWRIIKVFVEHLPPDKRRYYGESEDFINNLKSPVTEQIFIGNTEYIKSKEGKWIIAERDSLPKSDWNRTIKETKYFLTENADSADKSIVLFETFMSYSEEIKEFDGRTRTQNTKYTIKLWIDKNGLIIKDESDAESIKENDIKRATKRTITYEYNPKDLRIEAPKIEEK